MASSYNSHVVVLLQQLIPVGISYNTNLTFRGPCIVIYSYNKTDKIY